MPTRTKDQNTLVLGDWNARCDRCGFKFKASDLRKTWDNLYVCKDDWEERHPQDFLRGVPDNPSVPWTRPDTISDTNTTDISGNSITTDNAIDRIDDADKTLTVGSAHPVQEWYTDLTADRTVTLDTTGASDYDTWTIYRTGAGSFDLIIGSVKTTGIPSITIVEYLNGSWNLRSYTPLGL